MTPFRNMMARLRASAPQTPARSVVARFLRHRQPVQYNFDPAEPRDESGQWTAGSGQWGTSAAGPSAVPPGKASEGDKSPAKRSPPSPNDSVHSYLEAFNDTANSKATASEARIANRELREEGSAWQIVPNDKGGWEAAHRADLRDEYGDDWIVATNPLSDEPIVATPDWLEWAKQHRGDQTTQTYLCAFNDPKKSPATDEEQRVANEELAADGSRFRLTYDTINRMWIAVRDGQQSVQHQRRRSPMHYADDAAVLDAVTHLVDAEHDDFRHLADGYASAWNILSDLHQHPSTEDIEHADDELQTGQWVVNHTPEGRWEVLHAGQMPQERFVERFLRRREPERFIERFLRRRDPVQYAAEHSPKGGVSLNGRFYRGGQWIPASEVAKASPEEKAKLEEGKQKRKEARGKRGPVDATKLRERLAGHGAGELNAGEKKTAAGRFRALNNYHGALTHHRLEELTEQAEKALVKAQGNPVLESRARRELAALHHMTDDAAMTQAAIKAPKSTQPKTPKTGDVYNVGTKDLHVDPDRFQFKMKTDASGVTGQFKDLKIWNPDLAGVVGVWRDPANDKDYIVNGHHRHELADRLGVENMAVRYIKAKDAKEARAVGALINIGEERGTAVDASKFMRDMGVSPEDMANYGVNLKGKIAADAVALNRLSDRAFNQVARGDLDETKAVSVAKHLDDHNLQDKLFNLLAKREDEGKDLSGRVIEEMARKFAAAGKVKTNVKTLFGDIEDEDSLFVPLSEVSASVRAGLSKEVNDWLAVSNKRRAEKVGGAGNVLNVEENKRIAEQADQVKNIFDQLAESKGSIADALNTAAEDYHKAKSKKERESVKQRALESVRDAVLKEAGVGREADAGGKEKGADGGGGATAAEPAAIAAPVSPDAGRGRAEPAGLKEREPGFTGIDSHGHKWVNGEQVARGEEEPSVSEGKPTAPPPKTKEEFIAQEFDRLKAEHPDDYDEVLMAQAELNAEEWKEPPKKGKYDVGQTVSYGGEPAEYRGQMDGPDGQRLAVLLVTNPSGMRTQTTAPIGDISHPAAADKQAKREEAKEAKPSPKSFRNATHAADELQSIRNALAGSDPDTEALRARIDAVGQWAAAQKKQSSPLLRRIQDEAHSLADKTEGGTGKRGNRIQITEPAKVPKTAVIPPGIAVFDNDNRTPGEWAEDHPRVGNPNDSEDVRRVVRENLAKKIKLPRSVLEAHPDLVQEQVAQEQEAIERGIKPELLPKVDAALSRYANRDQTARGGGIFGGEDLQGREGFARLPDQAPIVFTSGEFEGKTGRIVHDEDPSTGNPRIVAEVDGRPGLVPIGPDAIEPLDSLLSWRTDTPNVGTGKQGGLFAGAAPPKPSSEVHPDVLAVRDIQRQLNAITQSGKPGEVEGVPVSSMGVGRYKATIGGKTIHGDLSYVAGRIHEDKQRRETAGKNLPGKRSNAIDDSRQERTIASGGGEKPKPEEPKMDAAPQQKPQPPVKIAGRVQQNKAGKHFIDVRFRGGDYDRLVSADQVEIGGKNYEVDDFGKEFRGKEGWRIYAYLKPVDSATSDTGNKGSQTPTPPARKTITRRTATRNVDAYRPGGIIEEDGIYYQVVNARRTTDDHGSYEYSLQVEPASEEAVKEIKIKKASDALSDASRSNNPVAIRRAENDLRALKGEPLLPALNNHADAKREQAGKLLAQDYDIAGRNYKARNLMVASGLFPHVDYSTNPESFSDAEVIAALRKIHAAENSAGKMLESNQ